MEFKPQAMLLEERLVQVQGLEDEHHDLKLQLKTLTVRSLQAHVISPLKGNVYIATILNF